MRSGPRIRIAAAAAVAAAAAAACLSHHQALEDHAERTALMKSALDGWRAGFDRDLRALELGRLEARDALRHVSLELSRMQARIVQMDALARRLVDREEFRDREFDFGREPGLGGPEEIEARAGRRVHRSVFTPAAALLSLRIEDRWRQLQVLDDLLKWRELNEAVRPEGRPVRAAYVSSGFGRRIDPFTGRRAVHKGVDFAGRQGTEIVAVAAGIVTWSGWRDGYGLIVEIDHGNQLVTRYAHNERNLVGIGDVVTRGQPIARLGSTGRASGPNLHFEVLQDWRAVNPLPYVR